jgi:dephospho-CoA kinase
LGISSFGITTMYVIGILGGVASGKSLATQFFHELGAAVLDGDRAGHAVLREPEVIDAARARWGNEIFDANGQINRAALASIVFAPGEKAGRELRFLEELTHPRIADRLRAEIERLAADGDTKIAVLDAPVMLKAGWDKLCDTILFVDVPAETRKARAKARGWGAAEFERREAAQEPVKFKKKRADVLLDNSGPAEKLRSQIKDFWDSHLARDMRN